MSPIAGGTRLIFESFDMIAITLSFALLSYIYADGRTDYFKVPTVLSFVRLLKGKIISFSSSSLQGVMMSMVFLILMVAYWFEPVPHY